MKTSGIILKTTPYKERDLILTTLLEDGHIVSFYAYGGRGGGKKVKPNILELGSAINFEIDSAEVHKNKEVTILKEYTLRWASKEIKKSFQAFTCMCLAFELLIKIIPSSKLSSDANDENSGVFNVVSNFLFYLDQLAPLNQSMSALAFFIGKLTFMLGVNPDLMSCEVCGEGFLDHQKILLPGHTSGFVCHRCLDGSENLELIHQSIGTYRMLVFAHGNKFSEIKLSPEISKESLKKMVFFLTQQFQIELKDLNSLSLLF